MGFLDGRTLGHFRVERLIGSGGMGAVYEAVDEKLERQVALKVLLREGDSSVSQKRFLREARLAAKLTHPNIATVFEVGEFEEHLYIVMELLEGQSLRKLLASQRLSTPDALGIARDVARALARAHASGVTHRDIKPENVFITTPSPNVLHAKVLDFGLARQLKSKAVRPLRNEEHTATDTTAPGEMLGTPGYWSPEQARSGEVDVRTDIFSFGILLYEMLTGRQAFRANSTVALVLAVTRHEPEPMRKYVPNIDPALEKLVARCIAKEPAERFVDGGVLLEEIEDVLRATNRTSQLDIDDTAADAHGPPVAAALAAGVAGPSSVPAPRPRESAPAPAPTPGPTSRDHLPPALGMVPPVDRLRLFVAIGAGIAVAGLLLIIATMVWGSSNRTKTTASTGQTASASTPSATVPTVTGPTVTAPTVTAAPATVAPSAAPTVAELAPEPPAAAVTVAPLAEPSVTLMATPLTVPVATATVAAVVAPAPAASHAAPPRPRIDNKKADCAQPFTIDAKGVKIPKLHCL